VKKISMALLGLIIAATGLTPTTTQAAAAPETATCTVPSGMIYNLPKNTLGQGDISSDDQFRWHRTMQCMFDAAPKGSKIMITIFSWADQPSADALRAADARGVTVQLIMWNGRTSSVMPEFAKALNDGKTPGSYFKVCKEACLGSTASGSAKGIHHSKVLTFSQVNLPGGKVAKNITSIGTGNFSVSNAASSFNVWRIVPNNAKMYNEASAYIAKMRSDKDQRTSKAKKVALGDTAMYLYPQKSYKPDLQLDLLNATSCKGAKKTIRVAQYMWTLGRKPIADRLAVLKKAGCDVKVILNNDTDLLNASVLKVLLKAKIPVYNAHRVGKVHTHAKDFYISALVGGKQQNIVVSGSLNMTRGSLNANDEAGYKINSATAFAEYNALWNIWAANSNRIGGASAASAKSITVPTTNDPTLIED
jgi:hypothetical protein